MKRRISGLVFFYFGAMLMIGISWLMSWWYCPTYVEHAQSSQLEAGVFGTDVISLVWALSGIIGPVFVTVGVLLYSGVERSRIFFMIVFFLCFFALLGLPGTYPFIPSLFGVGGGLILGSFLITTWYLLKGRRRHSVRNKTAADLRLLGYVAFFTAAWGLCGLLGVPFLSLRPDLAQELQTHAMAASMAFKVLICLVLGWLLVAVSHWLEERTQMEDA